MFVFPVPPFSICGSIFFKKTLPHTSAWIVCTRLRKHKWEDSAKVRIKYEQFAEYVNYYDNSVLFCENFQIIALNIAS